MEKFRVIWINGFEFNRCLCFEVQSYVIYPNDTKYQVLRVSKGFAERGGVTMTTHNLLARTCGHAEAERMRGLDADHGHRSECVCCETKQI